MIQIITAAYVLASCPALVVAAVVLWRRSVWHRRCLAMICRDDSGNLYARDPQTLELHRLEVNPLTGKVTVARKAKISPRQERHARRGFRRALRAIR